LEAAASRHQPQANGLESKTSRVIEQLQLEIDHLKKELADSKTQIHVAKVARDRADRSLQEQQQAHRVVRQEIDSLKRMLDRKERQVKEMEQGIKDAGKKSSDMKFERDNANTKLRQAELKASNLERELRETTAGKEQAEHEYELLSKEIKNFKRRYAEDVESVRKEFDDLREKMLATSRQLEDSILETGVRVEELTSESTVDVKELENIHEKLKENQEKYVVQFSAELENLKQDVEASSKKTDEHTNEVNKMRGEIVGKLNWLSRIEKART
jgi:chromosome segregation ATPase